MACKKNLFFFTLASPLHFETAPRQKVTNVRARRLRDFMSGSHRLPNLHPAGTVDRQHALSLLTPNIRTLGAGFRCKQIKPFDLAFRACTQSRGIKKSPMAPPVFAGRTPGNRGWMHE